VKRRFSEEQIIRVLKEREAGQSTAEICLDRFRRTSPLRPMAPTLFRHPGLSLLKSAPSAAGLSRWQGQQLDPPYHGTYAARMFYTPLVS
jgi:hypothetical protein